MPIVNGSMYPEAFPRLTGFTTLNVLVTGRITTELITFAINVDTLHVYVRDTLQSNIRIKIHCLSETPEEQSRRLGIERHDLSGTTTEELLGVVNDLDVDVVLDVNNLLKRKLVQDNFYKFQVVKTIDELIGSCEDFLTGNDVSWLFSSITWYLPLLLRYVERPGVCHDYFMFMGECTSTKGYSVDQQERVRYIANRLSQVDYSKDIINYYIKRMRKAERSGFKEDDYSLELHYHLSNYYFLISGIMDSMARLLNDIYRLKLPRHQLALDNRDFVAANRRKRTGYVRILKRKSFTNWHSFLKERRNFIAHDGDMRLSPLVEQNDTVLSNDEVERLVDQQSDWSYAARILTPEQIQVSRAQAAEIIRIQQDYKVVAKNVMIVPDANGGKKIYQPLRSIEYEYENLSKVMSELLDRLKR